MGSPTWVTQDTSWLYIKHQSASHVTQYCLVSHLNILQQNPLIYSRHCRTELSICMYRSVIMITLVLRTHGILKNHPPCRNDNNNYSYTTSHCGNVIHNCSCIHLLEISRVLSQEPMWHDYSQILALYRIYRYIYTERENQILCNWKP